MIMMIVVVVVPRKVIMLKDGDDDASDECNDDNSKNNTKVTLVMTVTRNAEFAGDEYVTEDAAAGGGVFSFTSSPRLAPPLLCRIGVRL